MWRSRSRAQNWGCSRYSSWSRQARSRCFVKGLPSVIVDKLSTAIIACQDSFIWPPPEDARRPDCQWRPSLGQYFLIPAMASRREGESQYQCGVCPSQTAVTRCLITAGYDAHHSQECLAGGTVPPLVSVGEALRGEGPFSRITQGAYAVAQDRSRQGRTGLS